MKILFFILSLIPLSSCFKLKMLSNDYTFTAQQALKYKNILSENTYNSLISKIKNHDIKQIFITNKLDAIISESKDSEGETLTDYSITKINPVVAKTIVDESNRNDIETYFLEEPQIGQGQLLLNSAFGFLDSYVFPFLFLSFIISLFRNNGKDVKKILE